VKIPIAATLALCSQLGTAAAQQTRTASDAPQPRAAVEFRWGDHPSLRVNDTLRIDFRARFQGDVRRSDAPLDEGGRFDVPRRRVGIDGEIRNLVSFQVERELQDDVPWRDVYVEYRQFDAVRARGGKFKLPFSLDENTSGTSLDFVHRSLAATHLAPGRDRGVMLHGELLGGALSYEGGLFAHDGDNALPGNVEQTRAARTIAMRAAAEAGRTFRAAVAWTDSDVPTGLSAIRGRTALRDSFLPGELWISGARRRVGLEAQWLPGPFSIQAEYIRMTEERLGQSVEDTDLPAMTAAGWYVSGTWAITGDRKSRGLDDPRNPLFQGGIGAIELAARVEALAFGEGPVPGASTSPRADVALGNRDDVTTFGVNWYVNRWFKLQANVVRDRIRHPDFGPLPEKQAFWSRVFRFQVTI
jgi:phosphate-selective porin OprO/OprP